MMTTTTTAPTISIGRIQLTKVRLTFAQGLHTPGKGGSTDPAAQEKYNCGLVITPNDPQVAAIKMKMQEVAKAKWKDKAVAQYNALQKMDKLALHDGDTKPQYSGYPGMLYMSPSTDVTLPPTLVITQGGINCTIDMYRNDKVAQVEFSRLLREKFYSGAYVNASVEFWAQDNKHGQRINCQLRGLQFHSDGDSFGGGGTTASPNEFEAGAVADTGGFDNGGFAEEIG